MTTRARHHVREATGPEQEPGAGPPRTTDHDGHPPGPGPRFRLGRIVATPGALATLAQASADPRHLLARHVCGDWGELDAEDRATNERALVTGARLLSAYRLPTGDRLWIITEADRSSTCILRPDEY